MAKKKGKARVPGTMSPAPVLPLPNPRALEGGDTSEAIDYAVGAKAHWEHVPGALTWLAA